ncbi:MAG: conjugal transfer protein TraN, partial [Pseudomonadota bacterium]|nr:conjugal transfer protein TraN [Pseudomonadota bacterium]
GVCVEWDKIYTVPKPGSQQTEVHDNSEGHVDALNADGALNDTAYEENREGAEAIAKLTALHDVGAAMPKINTGDANALSVFRGNDHRCVSQAGNNRCPGGNGKKEAGDQVLEQKVNEGKCIRIGEYTPETQNIGIVVGQKRTTTTYCCYDSVLAKVLHQGAIDQGIKERGDPKTTTCGALTLAQLQAMVWERVDFTPFVNEVTSKVNLNAGHVAQRSGETVRAHLDNQMRGARQQAQMREARS